MALAPKIDDLKPSSDDSYQEVLDSALAEFTAKGVDLDAPLNAPEGGEPSPVVETPTRDDASVRSDAEPIAPAEAVATALSTPATPPTTPAADPLADTAPLDYGQGKAFDGVLVDKTNGGAFILPDKLDAVRARLAEADTAREDVQQLSERVQRYEALGGVDGYANLKGQVEANSAAGLFLMKTLTEAFPGSENAAALKNIFERAEFLMQKSAFDTTQKFRAEQTQFVRQATQGQQEVQSFDRAIAQIKAALPALLAPDVEAGRQFFAKRPTLLYRNASPQDAQQYGVRVGERLFDPTAMNEWYSERAALRAEQAKEASARATAASAATKHNAAMDKGRQAGKPAPARRAMPATPAGIAASTEKVSKKQVYTDILDEALQELGVSD